MRLQFVDVSTVQHAVFSVDIRPANQIGGVAQILQKILLGLDPFVTPFKGVAAGGVVVVVFEDVYPADIEVSTDKGQKFVDRSVNIPAFIQAAEYKTDHGIVTGRRLFVRIDAGDGKLILLDRVIGILGAVQVELTFSVALGGVQCFVRMTEKIGIAAAVGRNQRGTDGNGDLQLGH